MKNQHFEEIDNFWEIIDDRQLDFDQMDSLLINKILKNHFGDYDLRIQKKMNSSYSGSVFIDVDIFNEKRINNAIIILSIPDDLFLVRYVNQQDIIDFLCDQVDGVDNCLKYLKPRLKFGFAPDR
jgi:hypothetical protein